MDRPQYLMLRAKLTQEIIDAPLDGDQKNVEELVMKLKIIDALMSCFTNEPPKDGPLKTPHMSDAAREVMIVEPKKPKKKSGRPRKAEEIDQKTGLSKKKRATMVSLSQYHRRLVEDMRGNETITETVSIAIEVLYKIRKNID